MCVHMCKCVCAYVSMSTNECDVATNHCLSFLYACMSNSMYDPYECPLSHCWVMTMGGDAPGSDAH